MEISLKPTMLCIACSYRGHFESYRQSCCHENKI